MKYEKSLFRAADWIGDDMERMNLGALLALCLLASIAPAVAADFTLEIFGNANMDDTIDEHDVKYVKDVIAGTSNETMLADANIDGIIDEADIEHITLMMNGSEDEIHLRDIKDRNVTIKKPLEHIVVLTASLGELIKVLGAENRIVAVCNDTSIQKKLLPDLSGLPNLGMSKTPDMELLIEFMPDIVFSNEYTDPDLINKLESAGITVVCLPCHGSLSSTRYALKDLGYVLGETDKADEFISWQNSYLDLVSERISALSEEDRPRVLYSWSLGEKIGTSGRECPTKGLIESAGGIDIAAEMLGEYIEVDPEWVIEHNPSIIVEEGLGYYTEASYEINDASKAKGLIESFANSTNFERMDAVRDERIYVLSSSLISSNECWIGLIYMAKLFHPKLFEDLDPFAINQEYLDKFLRVDFNLSEEGMLLYPVPDSWKTE
jgi:iron complex transport system substrate-binding protein